MLVYILFILLALFLRYNLSSYKSTFARTRTERRYLHILAFVLVLITALRGANVGTDTRNFLVMYVHCMPSCSFDEIFFGLSNSPLSFYLFKTLSFLHMPPQVLLGTISFIYISAIVRLIDKFSADKIYSFLCFFVIIGLYELSVPALKQCSAMGLALHGFLYLYDKKYVKAGLMAVLAFYFHKSSAIFLFGYMLWFLKDRKNYYAFIGAAFFMCVLASQSVLSILLDFLNDEHYSGYLSEDNYTSWTTFICYFILILFSSLFIRKYNNQNGTEARIFFGFAILATALQSLSSVVASAFRLATYFLPFFIVLLPNAISTDKKNGEQYKTVLLVFLLFFYFYVNRNGGNIVPYKFFWQDYDIPYVNFGG